MRHIQRALFFGMVMAFGPIEALIIWESCMQFARKVLF